MPIHNGMTDENRDRLLRAMPGLKARARTLVDLADAASFIFVRRPIEMDEKAAAILAGEGREHLRALMPRLAEQGRVDGRRDRGGRARPMRTRSAPSWARLPSPCAPR